MLARLRAAPVTAPLLLAAAIFLVWTPLDGGQPLTRWAPGALALLALVAVAAAGAPQRWGAIPPLARAAFGLLAAFTAWSFLSIAWADDQGAALEGADRTLLYLAVFALFALWPQRAGTAGWVLGAWTIGVGVLATVTLLRVGLADRPQRLFLGERLLWPAGYVNADAATWLLALWPAITLAAARRVPWALRGVLAGLAVVLCDVALLSQSRGAALSIPVCVLALVAFVPGRLRHLALMAPVALGAAAAAPAALDLGDALSTGHPSVDGARHAVLVTVLAAAAVVAVVVGAVAALETRRPPSRETARRLARAWAVAVAAVAVIGLTGGLVAAGGPVKPLRSGWHSFKGGYEDNGAGNRLVSGLGSNRYDFYRVALDVFADHPVAGVGADNFFQEYLRHGRSPETPRYPHDLAVRTLSQTGLVGTLLLLGMFGAALAAAWRAMRAGGLEAAVAGGAAMVFVYWVAHGMTDWFWEWAGLGAPAFAFLGLACSLLPRAATTAAAPATPRRRRTGALLGAALLAAAVVIAGPWLAERQVRRAAAVFGARPFEAYSRLDDAASLDPFSDRPALVKASIALRYGDVARAESAFRDALGRNPRGQYATLELGAIASARGRRADARGLLERAVALAPRDPIAREALGIVRSGGTVDVVALNARILAAGQSFAGT